MKLLLSILMMSGSALMLSACTDAYEERGLCSYFGACSMGLAQDIDVNYCKELGSCDDGTDPTEYTISGKPTHKTDSTHSGGDDSQ